MWCYERKKQHLITSKRRNKCRRQRHRYTVVRETAKAMARSLDMCLSRTNWRMNERKRRLCEDENLFFYSFILIIESICDMWRMLLCTILKLPLMLMLLPNTTVTIKCSASFFFLFSHLDVCFQLAWIRLLSRSVSVNVYSCWLG